MNDQTPLARVRAFQRAANPNGDYHWPAEEAANVGGVPLYFDDIESLAATDELDVVEVAIRRLREAEADRDRLAARVAELEAHPWIEVDTSGVEPRFDENAARWVAAWTASGNIRTTECACGCESFDGCRCGIGCRCIGTGNHLCPVCDREQGA